MVVNYGVFRGETDLLRGAVVNLQNVSSPPLRVIEPDNVV